MNKTVHKMAAFLLKALLAVVVAGFLAAPWLASR
jgi:hypothetical protein